MIRAIAMKELKVIWASPVPYILGAVFHATLGVLAWTQITGRGQAVFQPIVPIAAFLIVLVAPIVCARVFSEEIARGTLEVLLAVPVPPVRLVVGKYAAVGVTLAAIAAPAALWGLLLSWYGAPDPGPMLTGALGLLLLAGALAGIGVLASSLTASQATAAIAGLFAVLALWFAHVGSESLPTGLVAALSVSERLRSFAGGVIDLADVAYFVSVVVAALAGAWWAVSARMAR